MDKSGAADAPKKEAAKTPKAEQKTPKKEAAKTPKAEQKTPKKEAAAPKTPKAEQKTPKKEAAKTPKRTLKGGIVCEEIKEGNGPKVKRGKRVFMCYEAW